MQYSRIFHLLIPLYGCTYFVLRAPYISVTLQAPRADLRRLCPTLPCRLNFGVAITSVAHWESKWVIECISWDIICLTNSASHVAVVIGHESTASPPTRVDFIIWHFIHSKRPDFSRPGYKRINSILSFFFSYTDCIATPFLWNNLNFNIE